MNNNNTSELHDLIDFSRLFYLYKFRVLFVFILSIMIGIFYIVSNKNMYEIEIKIYPPAELYLKNFVEINYVAESSLVNSNVIKQIFVENFKNKKILINNLKKSKKNKENLDDSYFFAEARKFKTATNNASDQTFEDHFITIHYTFDETSEEYKYQSIRLTLEDINKEISRKVYDIYANEIQRSDLIRNINIEKLNNKLDIEIYKYELELLSKIAFLEEQATIARALGINSISSEVSDLTSNNNFIKSNEIDVGEENPYYLIGYEAIEKEIEQLKKKKQSDKKYSSEINSLKVELMDLKENSIANRMSFFLKELANSTSDQSPVRYNLSDIKKVKVSVSNILLSIVVIIVSITLCLLTIIISHFATLYQTRYSEDKL